MEKPPCPARRRPAPRPRREGAPQARVHGASRRERAPIMSAGPDRRTVGGVIVTYFPDRDFETRLRAIAREVGRLIVVDNSASPDVHHVLRPLVAAAGGEFMASPRNVGLGAALNVALRRL